MDVAERWLRQTGDQVSQIAVTRRGQGLETEAVLSYGVLEIILNKDGWIRVT